SLGITRQKSSEDDKLTSSAAMSHRTRRGAMLTNLRSLKLGNWSRGITKGEFLSILEGCPNLEKLSLECGLVPVAMTGEDISRICPNLRNILHHWSEREDQGTWPLETLATLPQNQLTSISIIGPFNRCWDNEFACTSFLRHSLTLREFNVYRPISSAAIALVLRTCNALEWVDVRRSSLILQDAIAYPWASSNINCLKLEVLVSLPSSPPDALYTPYYLQTPPIPATTEETLLFTHLELFYRQIGSLKEMRYLYLGTTSYNERGSMLRLFSVRALPGMLALSNNKMGRPGFLDLLSGWNQLEIFSGNIFPETEDDDMPAGAPEIEWVLTHWKSLLYTKKTLSMSSSSF
ncbi:hypothetical protein BGZ95_005037, partial [Linnemannia exigua]